MCTTKRKRKKTKLHLAWHNKAKEGKTKTNKKSSEERRIKKCTENECKERSLACVENEIERTFDGDVLVSMTYIHL